MKHMTEEYRVGSKSTCWRRDVERSQEVVSSKVNLGGQTRFQTDRKRKDHPNGGGSDCKGEKGK